MDVFVVDPDERRCAQLASEADESGAAQTCANVSALRQRITSGRPGVIVFGPGMSDPAGLGEIERITLSHPELAAILVSEELSAELFKRALRSGARDVLGAPVEPGALRESVERVSRTLSTASTVPVSPVAEPGPERGRAITVWSTKGGAGRSVVATNLAVSLAQRSEQPVALIDADLAFGDVAILLRLTSSHTVMDAVSALDRADGQLLQSMMVRHEPSGLLVLPAPVEPFLAEHVTGADMVRIVEILLSFCSFVVVDTPAQLSDVVVSLVEHSDEVVVVASMDVPNIKNVKLGLQTLRMLGVPESKLRLAVNRATSKVKLEVSDVERTLGLKAEALIPSDIAVPQTVNKGKPVVLDEPGSEVARAFEALAALFTGEPSAVSGQPKFLSHFNLF